VINADSVSDASDALSGATLVWVEAAPREIRVGVDGGAVVCLRAEGEARLATKVERGGPHGGGLRVYEDFEGRRIARVSEDEGRLTLRFPDGELLHLEAVVNEDGCRMATRSELEHARGVSSLLDRAVALLTGRS
jgi:hypothetical protein